MPSNSLPFSVKMPRLFTRTSLNTDQRLDLFYADILAGSDKMQDFWKVVKMVLILSHGSAAVKQDFLSTMIC